MVVRRERLFEPDDARGFEARHRGARILGRVAGIGVGENDQVVAEALPHFRDPLEIAGGGVADAELQRPVAGGDQGSRLLDERRRLLIAERDAARVGGNRTRPPPSSR